MSIVAITTCSAAGFTLYGRRMMDSWVKHCRVPLVVYTEGFRAPAGVVSRRMESIDWHRAFLAAPAPKPPTNTYRHDARRFSFKTAAVLDAARVFGTARYLVWVDADTVVHSTFPADVIEKMAPTGDEFISWLYREKNYPECGFYILDLQHPNFKRVMEHWQSLYTDGGLYKLAEWHDSWVLQWVISQYPSLKPKSISGAGSRTGHPFINGPLGQFMDHMKGDRKKAGRSGKNERVVKDNIQYWRK